MSKLCNIDDIHQIEAAGFEAYLPERTPYGILCATRDRTPEAVAIRFVENVNQPAEDQVITYDDLTRRVNQTARLFQSYGVRPTDSVAILGPHTPAAQIALWASELVGCACPINPTLNTEHIASLLDAAKCKLAVVLGENNEVPVWQTLTPGLREAGIEIPILDFDGTRPSSGTDGSLEELIAKQDDTDFNRHPDPQSIAALFHTGGTTGAPKMVQHTHQNQAYVGRSCALMYDLTSSDRVLNGFPLFHVAGAFVYGLSALHAGAELIIPGRQGMRNQAFVQTIWQQVEAYGITVIGGVPTVISALNSVELNAEICSLRLMLTGGSPLPTDLAEAFEARTNKPVRNILGMTETAGCISIEPFHGVRESGSCGLKLPFSDVQVLDKNTQPELSSTGESRGIIGIKGPNVSPGYTDPKVGEGVFLEDGWLTSGDIGWVDAGGKIFVTGRSKDVIIRGAHNIDPQAIEDALLSHPSLGSVAAVGMPDSYAGELPVAFVQLKPGQKVTPDELLEYAKAMVYEPAAVPKRIEIITEMPLTPIGKIFKPALRRVATLWAIENIFDRMAVQQSSTRVEIDDALNIHIFAPSEFIKKIRSALAGFPLNVTYSPTPSEPV